MAYTIVSFCGGGIRGLLSSTLLRKLTEINPGIVTNTKLLAGTSTGSGIVGSLVRYKKYHSPLDCVQDIIKGFHLQAEKFFPKLCADPNAPAYGNAQFIGLQKHLHGENTLSSLSQHVLFTAFNVGAHDKPWQPLLLTNVPKAPVPTADTRIADAVVASGSMPGMLPSYQGNVDGAFVHHDPTLAAIALAVNSGIALEEISVICFGTGFMANWIGSDTSLWGAHQWLKGDGSKDNRLPDLLINETGACPILNISLNGTSTNLIPMLSSMLLPGRYVYLNPVLDRLVPENAHSQDELDYLISSADSFPADNPEAWQKAKSLLSTYW